MSSSSSPAASSPPSLPLHALTLSNEPEKKKKKKKKKRLGLVATNGAPGIGKSSLPLASVGIWSFGKDKQTWIAKQCRSQVKLDCPYYIRAFKDFILSSQPLGDDANDEPIQWFHFDMNINPHYLEAIVQGLSEEEFPFRLSAVVVLHVPTAVESDQKNFESLLAACVVIAANRKTRHSGNAEEDSNDMSDTTLDSKDAAMVLTGDYWGVLGRGLVLVDRLQKTLDELNDEVCSDSFDVTFMEYPVPMMKKECVGEFVKTNEVPERWTLEKIQFPTEQEVEATMHKLNRVMMQHRIIALAQDGDRELSSADLLLTLYDAETGVACDALKTALRRCKQREPLMLPSLCEDLCSGHLGPHLGQFAPNPCERYILLCEKAGGEVPYCGMFPSGCDNGHLVGRTRENERQCVAACILSMLLWMDHCKVDPARIVVSMAKLVTGTIDLEEGSSAAVHSVEPGATCASPMRFPFTGLGGCGEFMLFRDGGEEFGRLQVKHKAGLVRRDVAKELLLRGGDDATSLAEVMSGNAAMIHCLAFGESELRNDGMPNPYYWGPHRLKGLFKF
ncbi:MAG: hypothetical protein CMI26_08325 [Opitutae bacterium]|nr:hypothetical protein [Opitutae bacterium]|tara:strand:- start:2691 stop:4373 length:1683 start_codon:yes stop_codon:yes gene_type:complete